MLTSEMFFITDRYIRNGDEHIELYIVEGSRLTDALKKYQEFFVVNDTYMQNHVSGERISQADMLSGSILSLPTVVSSR